MTEPKNPPKPAVQRLDPNLRAALQDPKVLSALKAEAQKRLDEQLLLRYKPYEKQRIFHSAGKTYRQRLLLASNQSGKELRNGTPVLTFDKGWVPIESLSVGDLVIARDGLPYPVAGVFPQGEKAMYRFHFTDGAWVDCGHEHLWVCRDYAPGSPWVVMQAQEMVQRWGMEPRASRRPYIPTVETLATPDRELERIEHVEPGEATCISVESPDRTFVTKDYIVTHNTYSAAAECAMHATGIYPAWWDGRRFDRPTHQWCVGLTAEATRDTLQRLLLGRHTAPGTGFVPKACILDTSSARSVANSVDTANIKHVSGGVSSIGFKAAAQGREKFQGETLDGVFMDEEPPIEIFQECLTRITAVKDGFVCLTFTPLLGMSEVVKLFYPAPNTEDRYCLNMTIDDALHLPESRRAEIIAGYLPHERDARARGIPSVGASKVYQIAEADITCPAFVIPKHWAVLGGIDLGWKNVAAVKIAHDRDADIVYVVQAQMLGEKSINQQAEILKYWGRGLNWAYPHDAESHDRASGETYATLYREAGLNMLPEHATHPEGGFSVEPGIQEMYDRMLDGRFRVFDHLTDWLTEFRNYSRDTRGRIVKANDHSLDATRIAFMMLRYAEPAKSAGGAAGGALRRNLRSASTRPAPRG